MCIDVKIGELFLTLTGVLMWIVTVVLQELMEEDLKRELARNELATKMALAKEHEAHEAKRRAQDAQVMMAAMLTKYETMKSKLDGAKTALAETATKTQAKEEIIDKITAMKERIESYANKKLAVDCLQDHVQMKMDHHTMNSGDLIRDAREEAEKYQKVQQAEEEKAERVKQLQELMKQRENALEKSQKVKVMLERQLEIGEKRAAEQNRIASAREKLLELKMKELELQKAKLARKKIEQEEKERATEDFIAMIDKQLEDMENNKTMNPKQKTEAVSAIIERHFNEEEKKEIQSSKNKTGAVPKQSKTAKAKTPEAVTAKAKSPEVPQSKAKKPNKKGKSPDPKITIQADADAEKPEEASAKIAQTSESLEIPAVNEEKGKSPTPSKNKNKKKNKNKNKNKPATVDQKPTEEQPEPEPTKVKSPSPVKEIVEQKTVAEVTKPEASPAAVQQQPAKTAEQLKKDIAAYLSKTPEQQMAEAQNPSGEQKEEKMTEEQVKSMVARVEGKCENIRDDIADMAMSEQYLRTKQALLKAKKKEQEMQIAQKMASIREEEVIKMREKVAKMQVDKYLFLL